MSDRGSDGLKYSGVSILNDVVDSVVYDLGLPHEAWDSCSYMNVCEQLGDVHTLLDCMRVQGKLQQSCSLTMHQLVHEIASNYDENVGNVATDATSALNLLSVKNCICLKIVKVVRSFGSFSILLIKS